MEKTFKTSVKFLSVFLVVLMVVMCYPFTAIAAIREAVSTLQESEVPEIVGYEEAVNSGYVNRLFEEESDLYSLLFGNLDGSKTKIVYDFPVKYIDELGNIKDKSTEIIERVTNGVRKFTSASNDVITTFSEKLSDGVYLRFDDVSTRMIYIGGGQDAILSDDGKTITYVINDNISLEYELTYSGYKEDIVVKQYTGQTHFDFLFYTAGMSLVEDGESYSLVDSDGNVKALLGDVIAFTADERNNTFGEINANAVIPNQIYKLTISVDEEWLKDENTVYPIRIDPTLEVSYNNNGAGAIHDVTINSADPVSGTSGSISLGKYASDNSVSRILMKFPGVNFSSYMIPERIINVSVSLRDLMPGTTAADVYCHRFDGVSWSEAGTTWSGVSPNSYSDLQSKLTVSYANGSSLPNAYLYWFDITNVAKQWVTGEADQAKGIIFKASDNVEANTTHIYKTFGSYNRASYKPSLKITYIDVQGENTTYEYDTRTLGENVTIKTNIPFGSIVATHSMNGLSKTFPITPAMVYNSTMKDVEFYDRYGFDSSTYGKFGTGWKLNLIELLIPFNGNLLYVDGSGAEFYFILGSDNVYRNEALDANISIVTEENETLYKLELPDGSVRKFTIAGFIVKLEYNNQTYSYSYNNGKLDSIKDINEKDIIKFDYAEDYSYEYMTAISRLHHTEADTNIEIGYQIEYSQNTSGTTRTLTGISDWYGRKYSYSTLSELFEVHNLFDFFKYEYTLTGNKVSEINYKRAIEKETGTQVAVISTTTISYTIGTNNKVSSVTYTEDDRINYIFDEKLRTANIIVTSSDGQILYDASAYSYDEEKTNAYITGAGSENLIPNSNFESTSVWSGTFTKSSEKSLFGSNSAKLTSNGNSVYRDITISSGSYVFSAYVNFTDVQKVISNSKGGIRLSVKNGSSLVKETEEYLCGTSDGGWIRMYLPFEIGDEDEYTFSVELINVTGDVYVDCLQLERGTCATTYNALLNGEFETDVGSWSGATSSDTSIWGDKSASVSSVATQTVTLGGMSNNRNFVISAWGKADSGTLDGVYVKLTFTTAEGNYEVSLPFGAGVQGKAFLAYEVTVPEEYTEINDVMVSLINESGKVAYFDNVLLSYGSKIETDDEAEEANDSESIDDNGVVAIADDEQPFIFTSNGNGTCTVSGNNSYTGTKVVIPSVSPNDELVTAVNLFAFNNNTYITYVYIPSSVIHIEASAFNGCSSLKEVYLNRGLKDIGDSAFQNCSSDIMIYYAGSENEWSCVLLGMNVFDEDIVINCNIELVNDLLYTYTRDANDYITNTTVEYVGPSDETTNADHTILTSAEYDSDGNLLSYTDELGNTTTYTYDVFGNVLTVTDANGTVTIYTYYDDGQLMSVSCGDYSNDYTYDNGFLDKVTHLYATAEVNDIVYDETYDFDYDIYGNLTSVNVGARNLVKYDYIDGGKGPLSILTYANDDKEMYTYDSRGNQIGIQISRFVDETQEIVIPKYTAEYDVYCNLLLESDCTTGNKTRYYADEYGSYTYIFEFDSEGNFVDTTITDKSDSITETHDVFDRITSTSLAVSETVNIIKNFTYQTNNGKTSYQISEETFSNGTIEQNITYNYEYDALGNLTNVAESGIINTSSTNQTKYYYDSLSQLVREDNPYANKTYTYEYDGNGNITSKKTYAYTTGTLGSVEDTITYSYGNSDWKDLLTSYDGTTISYDASGNPTYWVNEADITWTGRQLDSMEFPDGEQWTYQYDYNGLRTEREYSYMGEMLRYEYKWVDGKLAEELRYNDELTAYITLKFYYDGEELIGFNYNGDNYYYGKTNNGEIRFIYDSNGNIVTTYHYDAWGTPISTTGTLASTVGTINPFRYKSYYYDSETRLYYLQSRYYDPQVGRFLNADNMEYLGMGETMLSYSVFVYCENNPTNLHDGFGTSPNQTTVGFGLQIELSASLFGLGSFAVGLEFVWFTSNMVSDTRKGDMHVYFYISGGIAMSGESDKLSKLVTRKVSQIIKQASRNPSKLFSKMKLSFGYSICAFIIKGYYVSRWGYQRFNSYTSYQGSSQSRSYTVGHVKFFHGYSNSCDVYGIGYDSSLFGSSYSTARYFYLNDIIIAISNKLFSAINNMSRSAVPKRFPTVL